MESRLRLRRVLGALLALVALLGATGLAFAAARRNDHIARERGLVRARVNRLIHLMEGLRDAETGQRGFLLTLDAAYLEPYDRGLAIVSEVLSADAELPPGLRPLVEGKLAELAATLRLYQQGQVQASFALVRTHEGRRLMDRIQGLCAPVIADGLARLDTYDLQVKRLSWQTLGAVGVAFLLGLAYLVIATRQNRALDGAMRALRWQEARFRSLADHAPVGIFETAADGTALYQNAALRTFFGFGDGDPRDNAWEPRIHPVDFPVLAGTWQGALKSGTGFEAEYRIRRPGAADRWMRVQGLPSKDSEGRLLGFLGTVVDISFAKAEVDAARRDQLEQNRAFFDLAAAGLVRSDLETGRFLSVNGAFCHMVGYTESELLGMTFTDLTLPEDLERTKVGMDQARRGEIPGGRFEKRYRCKDGDTIWTDVSFAVMRDQDGRPREAATILVDIGERKAAEAGLRQFADEVRQLNAQLDQRVQQRTRELEIANKELEAFSYSVSHDLRAPLRHMDGFAGLLARHLGENLDEKAQHYLNRIGQSARSMGQLIDDLLAFSRMARQELTARRVDLKDLVTGIIQELPEGPIWEVDGLGTVQGDPAMLRQVFRNLLGNAVKFSRTQASPRIVVRSEAAAEGKHAIAVEDNGVGFDMAYKDKLFGVFQRLHPESQFEGTGIGLAIVARVVHRHGGEVWAESEPGRGACFHLTLPGATP